MAPSASRPGQRSVWTAMFSVLACFIGFKATVRWALWTDGFWMYFSATAALLFAVGTVYGVVEVLKRARSSNPPDA